MEGIDFLGVFEVFGDILEDFWRTFEEFWRNWFVEEKIKGRFKKVRFEVGELAAKISGVTDKVRAAHAIWVRLKASDPD